MKQQQIITKEQFKALTKKERKVLIAKDVLAQIEAGKYKPKSGSYIELNGSLKGNPKDNFDNMKKCTVCAIGACLMSSVRINNVLTYEDLNGIWTNPLDNVNWYTSQEEVNRSKEAKKQLTNVFSKNEIALIESCFEGDNVGGMYASDAFGDAEIRYKYKEVGEQYKKKFKSVTKRLQSIMLNFVRNNGKFIPKQDL